jgi:hypothetical protein
MSTAGGFFHPSMTAFSIVHLTAVQAELVPYVLPQESCWNIAKTQRSGEYLRACKTNRRNLAWITSSAGGRLSRSKSCPLKTRGCPHSFGQNLACGFFARFVQDQRVGSGISPCRNALSESTVRETGITSPVPACHRLPFPGSALRRDLFLRLQDYASSLAILPDAVSAG